jgi:hypothetical protein
MKIPALPAVECAILHERFAPMDGGRLLSAIEAVTQQNGLGAPCRPMISSTEKDVHVLVGPYRVLVSQNTAPLGPEGFRNALTTPFTGMVFPNARQAVESHRANTFVTVGKGPVPMPEEFFKTGLGDAVAQMAAFVTSEEALKAIRVCQSLARFMMDHNPASAVHWCASDNLVPQKFFEHAAKSNDPTLLNIRPYITSSAGRLGEGHPVGMTANGSQWLLGKIVAIDEAPVPLPWLMETLFGFVSFCLQRGSLIPHMDTFSVEGQDWQIGVFHEKIEGFDKWEMVRLKILHHPKYGIHGKVTTKRTIEYKDVDDLKKRPAAVENAAAPLKSGNMAELRELARASAAARKPTVQAPTGLTGRVRSFFGGKPN